MAHQKLFDGRKFAICLQFYETNYKYATCIFNKVLYILRIKI